MSRNNDAAAHVRWRFPLRALAIALVVATTVTSGAAIADTGGTTAESSGTTAKSSGKSTPTLRIGSRGDLVKRLQARLKVRPVSGYYGSRTARKVKFFQQDRGLRADGIAGPATLRALGLTANSSGGSTRIPAILKKIAQCESGGNPRAVSPGGQYRGKYQFSMQTWKAYGGSGDPIDAPESVQDRIALKLYRARGTAPWPNCG
jgi:peptidoglycan hydrolase-like protein with peptidoglycan-binding domain